MQAPWATLVTLPTPNSGMKTAPPLPRTCAENDVWQYRQADLVVRTHSFTPDAAQVTVCRLAPDQRETAASCASGRDYNCNGLVSGAEPECEAFLQPGGILIPRYAARRPSWQGEQPAGQ